ncbi:MAG: SRPBCC family protein [Armatimonadota bacterium]|nr:SRPBCC family protein [Armatimonadota bacterium]
MQKTLNTITINAEPDRVFKLAADVLNWPNILPHYRWVRAIGESGSSLIVEMAAKRSMIPVKWTSIQTLDRDLRRIYYEHIGGATRGMWVEWTIVPIDEDKSQVTILHELTLQVPIVSSWPGKLITGKLFVESIADMTLKYIKLAAETGGG